MITTRTATFSRSNVSVVGRLEEVRVDGGVEELVVRRVVEVAVGVVVAPAGGHGAPGDVVGSGRQGGSLAHGGHPRSWLPGPPAPSVRRRTAGGRWWCRPRTVVRSGAGGALQPLRDHRGDTVAAHGDAVQRVADLHGALLVRDDEQLGVLPELLVDLEQPAEVGVVERRLDLVEDVERRGAGLEERDEERHRHQGPLAAGEQREALDLLARRAGLDLDTGRQHVGGVGQHEPSLTAGEEPREGRVEGLGHVGVRLGEDLLDPLVDLADDVEEVLAGPTQVLELLGEELVPLLHGVELLERERVDPAEHRQLALGGLEPLLLLLAHERHRLGRLLALGHLAAERHQGLGAVVGDQAVDVHAELLERALLELLDAHPLLGAGHLVAVHGVDQLVVLAAQVAHRGADGEQLLLALLAGLLDLGALVGGQHHRALQRVQDDTDGGPDGLGRPPLADQPLAALGGPGAGVALGLRGAGQRVGAAVQRAGPLLGRAQREPGVHLALPRGAGGLDEALALAGVRLLVGGVLGGGEPRLQLAEPGQVLVAGLEGGGDGALEALGLARGRSGPASRTAPAPRRPPPAWRRTRAAWPARRRPA